MARKAESAKSSPNRLAFDAIMNCSAQLFDEIPNERRCHPLEEDGGELPE